MSIVGKSSQQYFGFDPRTIPGCQLWLDGADPNVLFTDSVGTIPVGSSGNIGMWRDKSGLGRHYTQTTSANRPSFVNNTVTCSTSSQVLLNSSGLGIAGIDIFVVGRPLPSTAGNWRTLFRGQTSEHPVIVENGSTRLGCFLDVGGFNQFGSLTLDGSTRTLIFVNIPTTRIQSAALNGTLTLSTTVNAASTATNFFALGNWQNGTQPWGDINEVILVSNTTTVHRQQIEGYLAWKWSLTTSAGIVSPSTIPGLQLWLDAADPNGNGTTPANGSSLTTWVDKSTNALVGTPIASPTYNTNLVNNLPGVVFNGTSQYINYGNVLNMGTNTAIHIFAICRFNTTGAGHVIGKTSFRGNTGRWSLNRENGVISMIIDTANAGFTAAYVNTSTTPQLLGGFWDRTTITSSLNGGSTLATTALSSSVNMTNTDPLWIGAYPNGSGTTPPVSGLYFNGSMHEILVYFGTITTTQRHQIEGYLAWKWGLQTNLPSSHPYDAQFALPGTHPYTSTPPIMRMFQPIDIAIPEFWYDAADLSTITSSGTTLTSIANKGSTTGSNITVSSGTHTTGVVTQNNLNLIRSPTGARLVFTGSFPVQARSRFVAARPIADPATTGITFLFQNFTSSNGYDTIGISANRLLTVAQGQIIQLLSVAVTGQSNVFSIYTFLNAATSSGNRLALRGEQLALTENAPAQQYFTGSANNFISGDGEQDMGEWISYNFGLTIAQAQQVEGYLAWKWGTQANLPTTHPYYRVLPSTPLFVPSQVSGLRLWLDAADSATITGTSPVTQWNDKSGNGRNATTGSGSVTRIASAINSLPALRFGNGISLNVNSFSVSNSQTSVFMILRGITAATSGTYGYFVFGRAAENYGGTGNQSFFIYYFIAPQFYYAAVAGNGGERDYGGASATNPFLSTNSIVGLLGNSAGFVNGTNQPITTVYNSGNPSNSSISTPATYQIGTSGRPDAFTFDLGELIVYDGIVTASQRQQIEGYLAWKWGLQNSLPPVAVSPITPSSISGLVVWNDASILTQSDGTALTTWSNGGSGGTVNCTGTVVTGGLNGLRVVRFTTAQTWSTVTAINLASHSFFFVSRQRGGANGRVWTGTTNQLYGYWNGYKRALYIDNNPGFLTVASSDTTWDLFSFTRTASGPYVFKWQGNNQFSGSTSSSENMVGLFINSGTFVEPSDCEIAEVILYNSVLTPAQVAGIESYLSSKWGVGGGASANSHPYKKFRA